MAFQKVPTFKIGLGRQKGGRAKMCPHLTPPYITSSIRDLDKGAAGCHSIQGDHEIQGRRCQGTAKQCVATCCCP